jgi:hypothetical protein
MCGGFFANFISPYLFDNKIEYLLLIIFSSFLRPSKAKQTNLSIFATYKEDLKKLLILLITLFGVFLASKLLINNKDAFDLAFFEKTTKLTIALFVFIYVIYFMKLHPKTKPILCLSLMALFCAIQLDIVMQSSKTSNTIYKKRNFYGTVIVKKDPSLNLTTLIHGNTVHGGEHISKNPSDKYYGYYKPIFEFFENNVKKEKQNIAIIGLGAGMLASLNNDQQTEIDFFEINPNIVEISKNPKYFNYLTKYPGNLYIGDGRVLLSKQPDKKYNHIIIDAYNSDAIPTHLITIEALQLYQNKLKKNGVIIMNISNRFFDLKNIVNTLANTQSLYALYKHHSSADKNNNPSEWMILHDQKKLQKKLITDNWKIPKKLLPTPWSDNYVNIFQALKL